MLRFKKILFSLFSVVTLSVATDSAYLTQNVQLFKDKNQKEVLGELIVATTVAVISKDKDISEIEFVGYAPEDSPTVYEKAGFLITGFEGNDFSTYKVIGKKVDEYDTEWFQIQIRGFVKNEFLSNEKTKIIADGKIYLIQDVEFVMLYIKKEEFITNVWPSILDNMGLQAGLTKEERMSIEKYLQN